VADALDLVADLTLHELHRGLASLNRRLARLVGEVRPGLDAAVREDLLGLYVTDAEVDMLLSELPAPQPGPGERPGDIGGHRMGLLAERLGLGAFERDVVLLGLAPELDVRYERLFVYLHNDITRRRPSVGLALRLLDRPVDRLAAHAAFAADAPLRLHHVIALGADESARLPPPLPALALRLDDRIVRFLLGEEACDERLRGKVTVDAPEAVTAPGRLDRLGSLAEQGRARLACLYGPDPHALREAARAVAAVTSRQLVEIDAAALAVESDPAAGRELAERALREVRLRPHAFAFAAGFDALRAADAPLAAHLVAAAPEDTLMMLGSVRPERVADGGVHLIAVSAPGHEERAAVWREALPDPAQAEDLAARFRLTRAQIDAAARAAVAEAALRDDGVPTAADLAAAARAQTSEALSRMARRTRTPHTFEDLVLPSGPLALLHGVAAHLRYRHQVFERWGFGARRAAGTGITALFAGPSGTGKTMAAGVIAATLGLDLYRIDLSAVVDKYIGETEKHLAQIFAEAEGSNAVLFFDEADALFGRRSEVKDARDRYANIEVAYLLQRMEDFDGLAILATNLRDHIDGAFVRRLRFVIEFPFPRPADRARLWRRHLPAEAPLAADIDFGLLSRLQLSGGAISNCALAAAFMAAEADEPIAMHHLVLAAAQELAKAGRPVLQSEFGEHYAAASARLASNGARHA
jgi:hypothetical protein